jgi:DNA-binding MarR family transcriptional regulator
MARARPVSRQHIQTIVNALGRQALIELAENPRHRRSKLVQLTPAGRDLTKRIRAREGQVLTALSRTLDATRLLQASETLAEVGRLILRPEQVPGATGGTGDGGGA